MTEPRRLGDRYELGEVLGYGGMAEVLRGRDLRLGRDVAVKTLRVDLARDPSFQSRFRREAQSAASLNHPTIVAVYDTGESTLDGVQAIGRGAVGEAEHAEQGRGDEAVGLIVVDHQDVERIFAGDVLRVQGDGRRLDTADSGQLQPHAEGRTVARRAGGEKLSAHGGDQPVTDGQAQARPAGVFVGLGEGREDALDLFGADADAGILHVDLEPRLPVVRRMQAAAQGHGAGVAARLPVTSVTFPVCMSLR